MKLQTVLLALSSTAAVSASALWPQSWTQKPIGALAFPVPGQSPLQFCGPTDGDILVIDYIDISPNPPTPGATLVIQASGTVKETITEGATIDIEVKYGFVKLITTTIDLCENVGEVGLKCPIEKGELVLTKEVELPKAIPPGKYKVMADLLTADSDPITCIFAEIIFKPTK